MSSRSSIILPRQSPLAFPAGVTPGFDPTHVAAAGITATRGISAITVNGGFVDLFSGACFTASAATRTKSINRFIGPATTLTAGTVKLAGQLSATPPAITMASIVVSPAGWGNNTLICIGNDFHLVFDVRNTAVLTAAAPTLISLIPGMAAATPYFLAVSIKGSILNAVALNLFNGKLITAAVSNATNLTGDFSETYLGVNFYGGGSEYWGGPQSAAMWSPTFLSLQQLTAWAADPWSFWYPRKPLFVVGSAAAPTTALYRMMLGY